MGIKEQTLSLFEDSCRNSERGLKTICEAEKYLQQAYEGRYFFELIQNVRDANKEHHKRGIFILNLKTMYCQQQTLVLLSVRRGLHRSLPLGRVRNKAQTLLDSKVLVLNRRWKFQIHLVSLPLKGLYILIESLRWKC